ncbi:MAG TPA: hypothetical protein VFT50_15530 [Baekduia sp.]|nr:hypothetical protein [Baekduia sp.]
MILAMTGVGTTRAATSHDTSPEVVSPAEAQSVETTAVSEVQPELRASFALFRDRPASGMPEAVAAQVGSPRRFGRNPALARAINTVTGTGWVIPGDGFVCVAVPDPVDGYGTTCMPTSLAAQRGVSIALWGNLPGGQAAETMLVPDGTRVVVDGSGSADRGANLTATDSASAAASSDDGVASAFTDHPGAMHLQ